MFYVFVEVVLKMKKIMICLMLGIFLISLASSSLVDYDSVKQNECMNISQACATCTYVNISSVSRNNDSTLISNIEMTDFGNGEWRYEFCDTSATGRYDVKGIGDINGVDSSFAVVFLVTHSGGTLEEGASGILIMGIIFMLVVGALCLLGFFRKDQSFQTKWTLFLMSFLFFLAGANLISALIGDTLANPKVISFFDSFMAISFLLFWFVFGLLAIMWILTMIQTLLFRKKQSDIQKYGGS